MEILLYNYIKNDKVLVLSGSSGHGFKLGPGLGEIVKKYSIK